MHCPKCPTEMHRETFDGIEIDRCPTCKGIYLDQGELRQMIGKKLGDRVDTFAFSVISDDMDQAAAHCPRCDLDMQVNQGPEQMRIDHCPGCNAVFLDEGELSSLQLHAN